MSLDIALLLFLKVDRPFNTDTVSNKSKLLEITPDDVCRWMNLRAFGEENPAEDAKPVNARASTLDYAKKDPSSFMPRCTVPWDPIRNEGNPTRSDLVNAVIKKVKRSEIRREGVQSAARRPVDYEEFIRLLKLSRSKNDKGTLKYLVSAVRALPHCGVLLYNQLHGEYRPDLS
ncbi:hypothetical protein PPTG_21583 [Phytophthora nicotianae INRA-310]|uniref:Uncharacterized protein n=1 Tax=Phytophthora nicotianae (strain INRA-310) TaxID=761204 RepID=W2QZG9_PHYN3|nr:hypothetical protein PPTG_21583 [Phytophthora nicotianae INRA-310]ETN18607.1 hypothetical protein PPTG_21583 [Phytophthora nicotianae INRA-310]